MSAVREKTAVRWTKAQRAALDWLPADGSWRTDAKKLTNALCSLHLYHRELIEIEWRHGSGPKGGRQMYARATEAGLRERCMFAARAEIDREQTNACEAATAT